VQTNTTTTTMSIQAVSEARGLALSMMRCLSPEMPRLGCNPYFIYNISIDALDQPNEYGCDIIMTLKIFSVLAVFRLSFNGLFPDGPFASQFAEHAHRIGFVLCS